MAFVEEEFSEEPIQVPPESLLYKVLDDYLRPNTSVVVTGTEATMDGATCIVQEEFPEEPIQVPPESLLHTVLDAHIRPNTSVVVTGTVVAMDGATCIIQEEFPTIVPPPLNPVDDCDKLHPTSSSRSSWSLFLTSEVIWQTNSIDTPSSAAASTCCSMPFRTHQPSRGARPACNPTCSSPMMTSFIVALRTTGSMVLTSPLISKSS
jgi:hypothetical protein